MAVYRLESGLRVSSPSLLVTISPEGERHAEDAKAKSLDEVHGHSLRMRFSVLFTLIV